MSYHIEVFEPIVDPSNDNIDVFVCFANGAKYVATFLTLAFVVETMKSDKTLGDRCEGHYFFWTDAIIVDVLSLESFDRVVKDLLDTGDFNFAFVFVESEQPSQN